jgi:hypothetical protein
MLSLALTIDLDSAVRGEERYRSIGLTRCEEEGNLVITGLHPFIGGA